MISGIIENPGQQPVQPGRDDVSNLSGAEPGCAGQLEKYRGYVGYLVRQTFPGHLARRVEHDDIVQDVMLKALESDPDFTGRSEGELLCFLRKTCDSVISDSVRYFNRGKRRVELNQSLDDSAARLEDWLAAVQSSPSQQASKHEQLLRLAQALAALPENQRTAVELHHLRRHSLAETAEMMGLSAAAVAGLLRRGLALLRDRLDSREHDVR
jgi:RNA polymerase sigma-70 factor (ECF subfamily)